ncbi:MAG TPA: hypothetical protein VHL11_15830 [Phototrophicaceae bacterium]|jgi:Tol biopolymer transport system component|nr:hypothetical protein [Phototrophicaceae bacterium]
MLRPVLKLVIILNVTFSLITAGAIFGLASDSGEWQTIAYLNVDMEQHIFNLKLQDRVSNVSLTLCCHPPDWLNSDILGQSFQWSPDGHYLAWATGKGTDGDAITYHVRDFKTQELKQSDFIPVWSPDMTRSAYFVWSDHELHMLDADMRESAVISVLNIRTQPIWSPDSTRLAWGDYSGQIYVMDAATGQFALVTDHIYYSADLTWSPDGKWLALTGVPTFDYYPDIHNLFLIDLVNGVKQSLSSVKTIRMRPAWSPDGDWLAINRIVGQQSFLYLIDPHHPEISRQIGNQPLNVFDIAWSQDGQRLLFGLKLGKFDTNRTVYYTISLDGSDLAPIEETVLNPPGWTPNAPIGNFIFRPTR